MYITSQYLSLLTPSEYALANLLSLLRTVMAALNCVIGWRLCGKLFSMVITWLGRGDLSFHSCNQSKSQSKVVNLHII